MGRGRTGKGAGRHRGDIRAPVAGPTPRRLSGTGGTAALLLALTFVAYLPTMRAGFIWDDDVYITNNPNLTDSDGLRRIWTEPGSNMQYYPLTFTVLWVEHQLWGTSPLGYHAVNVALQGACAVLFWLVLVRLGAAGARLAAALFAVHPVLVESVAWSAEVKNVLSGALCLLALLAYLAFDPPAAPGDGRERRWGAWAGALALFAAALLAKSAVVPLPFVIVLLYWWHRGRLGRREVLPLVPMVAIGLVMGLVTVFAEHEYSAAGWHATLLERVLVAGRAVVFYARTLLLPVGLTSVYPRWDVSAAAWWQYLFPAAVAGVLVALWMQRGRIGRGPLVAAASYCLLLGPALGFFDVAYFRYSFVADHLQYHAAPALIALVAAGIAGLADQTAGRPAADVAQLGGVAVVLGLTAATYAHAGVYASERARCAQNVARNPDAWVSMECLALVESADGNPTEAIRLHREALRVNPDYADAHNNLANVLVETGRRADAVREYEEALRCNPDHPEAHENLGKALEAAGGGPDALRHLSEAVRVRPWSSRYRTALGVALARRGRYDEAVEQLRQAAQLDPSNAAARGALERALALLAAH